MIFGFLSFTNIMGSIYVIWWLDFEHIQWDMLSIHINYQEEYIPMEFLNWKVKSWFSQNYLIFRWSLNFLKWQEKISSSRPLNISVFKCKEIFPKVCREQKREKLLGVLKDACPMDIFKISQLKHLKHERTSACIVIRLKCKN